MATKESIGQRLAGLPSHIQRGLHELFHHLYEEIEQLRSELRALTGGDAAPEAPTTEIGDVVPGDKPEEAPDSTQHPEQPEQTEPAPDELPTVDGAADEPTTETGDNA